MKKIITIVLLLAVTFTFAQVTLSPDYDYKVSEPYRVVDARSKEYFSDGKSVLSLKVKPKKNQILLQKYDVQNMKEIGKKYYNDLPKNFVYEGLVETQGKYYFFYSSWSGKKTKQERLYYREIDFKSGTFKGEAKKLIDYNGRLTNFYRTKSYHFTLGMKNENVPKFNILVSKDKSKILIQYLKKLEGKEVLDIIDVNVFDISFNKIWSKTYTIPYHWRKMTMVDNLIDNEGNIFMLTSIMNKSKKGEEYYHLELFKMNNNLNKIAITPIQLDNIFIDIVILNQLNKKELILAGYYQNTVDNNGPNGFFIQKISKTGELISNKKYEISAEIINQYKRKAIKKKKGKPYDEFAINHIIINTDNSITIVGEAYYSYSVSSPDGGYSLHYYNDILVSKIKPNGDLDWIKKIPKRQRGSNNGQGGMSYTYFKRNDNLYFTYIDNIKNYCCPIKPKIS